MLGKRFRRRHARATRLHPIAIVGICLAAAILLTVIVGNLLKGSLDDETYKKLTQGEETDATNAEPPRATNVRNLNAYPFALGQNAEDAVGMTSISVSVNTPDGTILYTSDVTEQLGLTATEKIDLQETLGEVSAFVPYVSGVFYPQAFEQETPDARYAVSAVESAILREFLHAGGSEILLCGLPLAGDHTDTIIEYVKTIQFATGNAPIGIAIPLSIAADTDNWELLARLFDACDFLAIDLTAEECDNADLDDTGYSPTADAILARCAYFVSQFDARLIFSDKQTALISTAQMQARPDFQVIHYAQKTSESETDEQ
ncbi:MAG: hypothetical protein IJD75_06570 [Clostridia bacterium]|nr:hypothetical protein [Clostridia bacterium]